MATDETVHAINEDVNTVYERQLRLRQLEERVSRRIEQRALIMLRDGHQGMDWKAAVAAAREEFRQQDPETWEELTDLRDKVEATMMRAQVAIAASSIDPFGRVRLETREP